MKTAGNQAQPKLETRPIEPGHKARLLEMVSGIWDGDDYLPKVFDAWVRDRQARFLGLFADGRLVGCGRMMPFDRCRVWLEALRVDPADQGKGWGREITRRMLRLAVDEGHQELFFSTYFRNEASIRITEQFGFRPIAHYSLLTFKLQTDAAVLGQESPADTALLDQESPADAAVRLGIESRAGLPAADGFLWNDWFFVPPDAPRLERYFPQPETVRHRDCTVLLCDNGKYGREILDIGWISKRNPESVRPCLEYALARARAETRRRVQIMLPHGYSTAPFLEAGFRSFEREGDVILFRARADQLSL